MHRWITAVIATATLAGRTPAAPPRLEAGSTDVGEQLLYPPPDGYTVVTRSKNGNREHVEIVPQGQSAGNCTDMIIAQVTRGGLPDEAPTRFAERMAALRKESCPALSAEVLADGQSNGYPYALW